MLVKYLKIQIIIFLLACPHLLYAQKDTASSVEVVVQINNYLHTAHLSSLIKATGFSLPQTVTYNGAAGVTSVANVQVLTIEPNDTFPGPLEFAAAWRKLQQKLDNKQNINWQLFFKLVEFSGRDPQSLAILITTSKPRIYSILVYYDHTIKIAAAGNEIKGISNFNLTVDPEKDFACSTYLPNQPNSKDLQKRLIAGIKKFLTSDAKGNSFKNPVFNLQHENDSFIIFTAGNLPGKITGKFYEVIELYLSLSPADANSINIGYNFNMHFGSEPYTVTGYANDYEDGLRKHAGEMAQFNRNLSNVIQKIVKLHEISK